MNKHTMLHMPTFPPNMIVLSIFRLAFMLFQSAVVASLQSGCGAGSPQVPMRENESGQVPMRENESGNTASVKDKTLSAQPPRAEGTGTSTLDPNDSDDMFVQRRNSRPPRRTPMKAAPTPLGADETEAILLKSGHWTACKFSYYNGRDEFEAVIPPKSSAGLRKILAKGAMQVTNDQRESAAASATVTTDTHMLTIGYRIVELKTGSDTWVQWTGDDVTEMSNTMHHAFDTDQPELFWSYLAKWADGE